MKNMYPKNGRVILHVDMNSFYASAEAAANPELKGKPLAIAGNPEERRGIIVTSSYEARAKGVKTTMPLWEAKRLCPDLIVRRPNFSLYRNVSNEMFGILFSYTPLVEQVSIDEGYLDISECYPLGSPLDIARQIQGRIKKELDLPCSIGISPNKFLAKMASDMKKPMGITILRKRDVPYKLWPLPLIEMHGVGAKTAEKLGTINMKTIGDLANGNEIQLKQLLGINGERLKRRANGVDERPVDPDAISEFKSIGNSTTLPYDTEDVDEVKKVLQKLAETVASRLRKNKVLTWNIQIIIRYNNRKTINRSRKLNNPIQSSDDVFAAAFYLFQQHWNNQPIRLLGITAQDLVEKENTYKQLDIFSIEENKNKEKLYEVMEKLKDKYGKDIFKK